MSRILFYLIIPIIISMVMRAQGKIEQPLEAVASVDLQRYSGMWYEIARLPNRFQEDCAGDVTATYTLLDDGQIKVVNRCRGEDGEIIEAEGRARKASTTGPDSKLEVRFAPAIFSFLPFVWGKYWILELAYDYRYAVVGEPDREYLWILARSPQLDEETIQGILGRMKTKGYDVDKIIRTKQTQ